VLKVVFFTDSALIAFVAAITLFHYKKQALLIKLLGLIYLAGFVANACAYIILKARGGLLVNLPASLYDFVFVAIVSVLYYVETGKRYKSYFVSVVIIFTIAGLINLLLVQQTAIGSYNKLMGSFVIISYAVLYFYRLMTDLPTTHLHRLPMFWFNAGFLIYHAGNLFLFAFVSYLIHVLHDDLTYYWTFHNILHIIQEIIVITGLYFYYVKRPRLASEGLS
jgi:hypothetical protein